MPFVNTAPTYQTVEITVTHKIKVRYTCPNCGKDSDWIEQEISSTAESTGHIDTVTPLAQKQAEIELDEKLKAMTAENMVQILPDDLRCPHCHAQQLPGRPTKTVSRRGCLPFAILFVAAVIALCLFLFGNFIEKTQTSLILTGGIGVAVLLGLVIGYFVDMNRRNRLAASDPKLQYKYLGAVHQPLVAVDFCGRGPGGIVEMTPAPEPVNGEEE